MFSDTWKHRIYSGTLLPGELRDSHAEASNELAGRTLQ